MHTIDPLEPDPTTGTAKKPRKSRKRRGRGEGSIYFDPVKKLWCSQISLGNDPVSGQRVRKTVYGDSKEKVQGDLIKLQQEALQGNLAGAQMLARNFLDMWLTHQKGEVSKATYGRYEVLVRKHLRPQMGTMKLAEVSAFHVKQLYQRLEAAGVPSATRHLAGTKLRQAFKYAVLMGLLHSSPADKIKAPRLEKRDVLPFSFEELTRFLEAAGADRLYALYVLAVDSGARINELLALTWEDVDFGAGMLRINKTLTGKNRPEAKPPKSKASRRTIPLTAPTLACLQEYRQRVKGVLLFPNRKGGYMLSGDVLSRYFYPVLKRAGITRRGPDGGERYAHHFHDLRHTCATLLLNAGVNIKVVSERLGHANIKITLDTYAHVMPSMQQEAVARLGGILTAALPGVNKELTDPKCIGSAMAAEAKSVEVLPDVSIAN